MMESTPCQTHLPKLRCCLQCLLSDHSHHAWIMRRLRICSFAGAHDGIHGRCCMCLPCLVKPEGEGPKRRESQPFVPERPLRSCMQRHTAQTHAKLCSLRRPPWHGKGQARRPTELQMPVLVSHGQPAALLAWCHVWHTNQLPPL